jgi:hypothetical protein
LPGWIAEKSEKGRMKLGDSEMIFKDCRFQAPFLHVEKYVSIPIVHPKKSASICAKRCET